MICLLDIKPDISKWSEIYKEIRELSDFRKELEPNDSNVFFNLKEISLKSDAVGCKELFEKIFKLATDEQKLFNLDEKNIKEVAIYRPYDHL